MYAEKPIFIIAAPRSGSTLLFETLMRHQQLWSFGDEGHAWIEK
jgi:LPS sulfotransferase NodH